MVRLPAVIPRLASMLDQMEIWVVVSVRKTKRVQLLLEYHRSLRENVKAAVFGRLTEKVRVPVVVKEGNADDDSGAGTEQEVKTQHSKR